MGSQKLKICALWVTVDMEGERLSKYQPVAYNSTEVEVVSDDMDEFSAHGRRVTSVDRRPHKDDEFASLDEDNGNDSDFIKSGVFGALDGVNFSMVMVSAGVGCGLEWELVLILALSALAASCVVVGGGEFFSSRAHRAFVQAVSRREQWNYRRDLKSQIKRLSLKYHKRGMNIADSNFLAKKMSTNEQFFIGQLVSEDIGLQVPDDSDATVLLDVMIMLLSYFCFGALPVSIFFLPESISSSFEETYKIFLVFGGALTLVLGAIKSSFSQTHWSFTALEAGGVASFASTVAYMCAACISSSFK